MSTGQSVGDEPQLVDIKSTYTPASVSHPGGSVIPKKFFQTYKTSIFDQAHAHRIAVFRDLHPEFDFHFFDDATMNEFMLSHWSQHPIYKIYQGAKFGPSKADIWRYCVLSTHGGIYLDIDSEIKFNMNSIPDHVGEMVSFEENILKNFSWEEGWPCGAFFAQKNYVEKLLVCPENIALQWLLAFRPGHPILLRVIDLIAENAAFYANRKFNNVLHAVVSFSGPIIFTQAVWEFVQSGQALYQLSHDFNRLAVFKSIPEPAKSVYLQDDNYYARKTNTEVLAL
jgi:mannosyltransferase OCH1-like enzyme